MGSAYIPAQNYTSFLIGASPQTNPVLLLEVDGVVYPNGYRVNYSGGYRNFFPTSDSFGITYISCHTIAYTEDLPEFTLPINTRVLTIGTNIVSRLTNTYVLPSGTYNNFTTKFINTNVILSGNYTFNGDTAIVCTEGSIDTSAATITLESGRTLVLAALATNINGTVTVGTITAPLGTVILHGAANNFITGSVRTKNPVKNIENKWASPLISCANFRLYAGGFALSQNSDQYGEYFPVIVNPTVSLSMSSNVNATFNPVLTDSALFYRGSVGEASILVLVVAPGSSGWQRTFAASATSYQIVPTNTLFNAPPPPIAPTNTSVTKLRGFGGETDGWVVILYWAKVIDAASYRIWKRVGGNFQLIYEMPVTDPSQANYGYSINSSAQAGYYGPSDTGLQALAVSAVNMYGVEGPKAIVEFTL